MEEDLVALLLPYIVVGLGKGANEEYRAGIMIIVGGLATRTALSDDVLSGG